MSDNRREALEALRDVIRDGVKYETMGHTRMCQKAFPKPDDFDGSREAYANSAAQQAVLVWRNGDINAAVKLIETVLPGWDWLLTNEGKHAGEAEGPVASLARPDLGPDDTFICSSKTPACALLLSILSALISETPKGETP